MSQPVPTPTYDALELPHRRFVDRLLMGDTKQDAYADAYPGASRESAESAGPRLFGNVRVQAALTEVKAKLADRVHVTPQRIVEELAAIGFARMRTFVTWGPEGMTLMPDETLSLFDSAAVSEVRQTVTQHGGSLGIKLHDKKAALDKLAEMFDVTPALIKQLYPQMDLATPEAVDGVVDIFKKAQERKRAAEQQQTPEPPDHAAPATEKSTAARRGTGRGGT